MERQAYRAALESGAREYASAITLLREFGFPATFTQTGGMCAALEVQLERGTLLITDAEDELPWQRQSLRGWGVGYYATSDVSEGPVVFVSTIEVSDDALVASVRDCMAELALSANSRAN